MKAIKTISFTAALLLLSIATAAFCEPTTATQTSPQLIPPTSPDSTYAVVISKSTWQNQSWRPVAEALREKHNAAVIVYPDSVSQALQPLTKIFPKYACFVATPTEADRPFIVAVHRLTRTLDDDPYTDLIWAVLTGYDANDALRIARHSEPLTAHKKFSATKGINAYFLDQPDRFTLAESFYANNQALMHKLESGFLETDNSFRDQLESGIIWDTVAFYGDPACSARLADQPQPFQQTLTHNDNQYTFTLTANQDGNWPERPIFQLLPHRIKDVIINQGEDYRPVITDNFILVPLTGSCKKGDIFKFVFHAEKITPADNAAHAQLAQSKLTIDQLPEPFTQAAKTAPEKFQQQILQAFADAGDNRTELLKTLTSAPAEHRTAAAFLIANMPQRDRQALTADFLLENIKLAYQTRESSPWKEKISDDMFLNFILPYVNLNERRDNWRQDFFDRFHSAAWSCPSISAAALKLNHDVYETFNVRYHPTKRPKPDQSPYETTAVKYASCTGLSILLADACRAVGIPARVVGTPAWTTQRGNHTWIEIWDDQWHHLGAAEQSELDNTWFTPRAAKADPTKPQHRIYAASFQKTPTHFPLVWDWSIKYVSALDVTQSYMEAQP